MESRKIFAITYDLYPIWLRFNDVRECVRDEAGVRIFARHAHNPPHVVSHMASSILGPSLTVFLQAWNPASVSQSFLSSAFFT